jgi:Flp pilus assembly pilin Flp
VHARHEGHENDRAARCISLFFLSQFWSWGSFMHRTASGHVTDKKAGAGKVNRRRLKMKRTLEMFARIIRDENGGEVVDYALIVGFIVVGALVVIGAVGQKALIRWNSLNNNI